MSGSSTTTTPAPPPVPLLKPKEIWNTMPGWGIVANLTPHELIVARRIQSIRKYLTIVLVALVLVLGGLYGWAWTQAHSASSDLAAEQDRSSMLTAQQSKYGVVTTVQKTIAQISQHVASLMTSDVDMSKLTGEINAALPAHATLGSVTITISKAGVTAGNASNTSAAAGSGGGAAILQTGGATGLNGAGEPIIGNVQVQGNVSLMSQVAAYVAGLRGIPGVTNVIPTINSATGDTRNFTITFGITDKALSHNFDVTDQGGSK